MRRTGYSYSISSSGSILDPVSSPTRVTRLLGGIVFAAILAGVGYCATQVDKEMPKHLVRRHVGDCVKAVYAESWEPALRIEMVGDHSYVVRETPASLYRPLVGFSPFFDSLLKDVPCPT